MGLRVVQWATGGVGVAAIKGVLEHPDLELVGCWVHSEHKAGKDVGSIIEGEPLGVTATNSVDEILALDADAVVYAPLLADIDSCLRCCGQERTSSRLQAGSIRAVEVPQRCVRQPRRATRRCTAPGLLPGESVTNFR